MKDYKVIPVKYNVFRSNSLATNIEEILNKHSRSGWSLEHVAMGQQGTLVILSKPKMT
jgi:hypothetical protein